jgi:hypothetical protein
VPARRGHVMATEGVWSYGAGMMLSALDDTTVRRLFHCTAAIETIPNVAPSTLALDLRITRRRCIYIQEKEVWRWSHRGIRARRSRFTQMFI